MEPGAMTPVPPRIDDLLQPSTPDHDADLYPEAQPDEHPPPPPTGTADLEILPPAPENPPVSHTPPGPPPETPTGLPPDQVHNVSKVSHTNRSPTTRSNHSYAET